MPPTDPGLGGGATARPNKPKGSPPGGRALKLSPLSLIAVLVIAAVLLGAAGVCVLAGLGWTLIFLAASCAALALVMARGVMAGG